MPAAAAQDLIARIKAKPHRKLIVRPKDYIKRRLGPLHDMWDLIRDAKVSIIEWDFPHIGDRDNKGVLPDAIWGATDSDFSGIQEYWELHRSGQFVFLTSFHELRDGSQQQLYAPHAQDAPKLSTISQIYDFTEMFEFIARYVHRVKLTEGISVQISHDNMQGLVLGTSPTYVSVYAQPCMEKRLDIERELTYAEAITRNRPLAIEATEEYFDYFMASVRPDVLRKHQDTYYSYRMGEDNLEKRFSDWP